MSAASAVVRVLPDVAGLDGKEFDYLVPDTLRDQVRVGAIVRVELARRRVRGWVVATGVEPVGRGRLLPIAAVVGRGPLPEVVDLARWASWRWAGRLVHVLDSASPQTAVRELPPAAPWVPPLAGEPDARIAAALEDGGVTLLRLPPGGDPVSPVVAALRLGPALVLNSTVAGASALFTSIRAMGIGCALVPGGWGLAAAGGRAVFGARSAVWTSMPEIGAIVVIDEHDESYKEERAPTWHARDVAVERARRAGVPCLLVSPCPSLEARAVADRYLQPSRNEERAGWPIVDVVDRRAEGPTTAGLYSSQLVARLRDVGAGRALCVLNRLGRSQLLACGSCGAVARCAACGAAVRQAGDESLLTCLRCGTQRPRACQECGSVNLRNLRAGVRRVREELHALLGETVGELSSAGSTDIGSRVVVGTEALLARWQGPVGTIAFLELDQELLAPRYRAAEQALALLARAARLLGGRALPGRLLLQTRQPQHVVVTAVLHAEPEQVASFGESERKSVGLGPASGLAAISGPGAPDLVASLEAVLPLGAELAGPANGQWLMRAPNATVLADALASVSRPSRRVRVEVDPLRV